MGLHIRDLIRVLEAEFLCGEDLDKEVRSACGSDLMSDVLAFVKEQTVLLTGLTNAQVIRTAEMVDIPAVVFVRGKRPSDDVIQMAADRKIAILMTRYTMFEACGLLYQFGIKASNAR